MPSTSIYLIIMIMLHYVRFLTLVLLLSNRNGVFSQEGTTTGVALLRGAQQNKTTKRQLNPFVLSEELKNLDTTGEPHKRCALDFLQGNIDRNMYQIFTCYFKGLSMMNIHDITWGCGYNVDLEEAARLYDSDSYLPYQEAALDLLQSMFSSEKPKEWNEFLGYWRNEYICEFLLTNVMKYIAFHTVAYEHQRCAIEYIQYHTQSLGYYKDFSCEFFDLSPGCGKDPLDLEMAVFRFREEPFQVQALNRLQEKIESQNLPEWNKFIEYWRKQDKCYYNGARGKLKILHLGDSYSAGNGAEGPEEAITKQPMGCHRNLNNWGRQLEAKLQETCHVEYINRACHGGVTSSIIRERRMKVNKLVVQKGLPIIGDTQVECPPDIDEAWYEDIPEDEEKSVMDNFYCYGHVDAQVDFVDHSVDVVFLTIGGNDLNFGEIATNCLVTKWTGCDCEYYLHEAEEMLKNETTKKAIKNTFNAIRGKMRPDAKIVYSTYPHLVPEGASKTYHCKDKKHDWYASSTKKEFDASRKIRSLGQLFEDVQKEAIEEANDEAEEDFIIFFSGTKKIFNGTEPHPNAVWENHLKEEWLHDFGGLNAGGDFLHSGEVFEAYHPNEAGQEAWANGIYDELLPQFNSFCLDAKFEERKASLDLAIVLDTTGSMGPVYDQVALQLNRIFDDLESKTAYHRVALVSYKDFSDFDADLDGVVRPARVEQSFTNDIEEVRQALQSLSISGGGDWREAVFSGVHTALHKLSWKAGAAKVMMIIGDAPPQLDTSMELPTEYLSLYTADELVKTSFELDPVAIVSVDSGGMTSDGVMTAISAATGGMDIDLDSAEALGAYTDLIISKITQQPFAWIGESYVGKVGETITFDARGSYDPVGTDITSYIWDFDGDGVNDQTTTKPEIDHIYDAPFQGFVYVSVVSRSGLEGLASAQVTIHDENYEYRNTLPECELDELGMPIVLGDDGFLSCIISDTMIYMKADPKFVEACDQCFDELDGSEEATMLRNAYDSGDSTEFATILCNLSVTSDQGSSSSDKKGKKGNKGNKGSKSIRRGRRRMKPKGTKDKGTTVDQKKSKKKSKKSLSSVCGELLDGAACPS